MNKKLKKYYFNLTNYPDWKTGGEKYQAEIYRFISGLSEKVFIFGNSEIDKKFSKNKLLRIIKGLFNILQIPRYSVIITTNANFFEFIIPLFINRLWKKHNYFLIIHHLVIYDRPSFFRGLLEFYFIKKIPSKVTVSKTTLNTLMENNLISSKIKIIPPGLDVKHEIINSEKIFPNEFSILFVGNIEKRKGLVHLINAFKLISDYELKLIVVGRADYNSEYYIELMKIIKANSLVNIIFTGKVEEKILEKYYLNSSVFVSPSLWEGYGIAVADAMAYGLPIVASRIPAHEELILHGINGIIVDQANPEALAKEITNLIEDKEKLKFLSRNAKMSAKEFLNWDETSKLIWNEINQ